MVIVIMIIILTMWPNPDIHGAYEPKPSEASKLALKIDRNNELGQMESLASGCTSGTCHLPISAITNMLEVLGAALYYIVYTIRLYKNHETSHMLLKRIFGIMSVCMCAICECKGYGHGNSQQLRDDLRKSTCKM